VQLIVVDCTSAKISRDIIKEVEKEYSGIAIKFFNDTLPIPGDFFDVNSIMLFFSETEEIDEIYAEVIKQYRANLDNFALIVPIVHGAANFIKGGLEEIKALRLREEKAIPNLVKRVGAYLGLLTIPKDNKIFISYTVCDGTAYAENVEAYLKSFGFKIWRDENRDEDNEGNIIAGTIVQPQILKEVEQSNLLLVIDTSGAAGSKWVGDEIDHANEHLVPVIPLCIRAADSPNKGSHIRKLKPLNRYLESDLSLNNLGEITEEIFLFLSQVYKRKRDLPRLVSEKFINGGYTWQEIELRRLLYESSKKPNLKRQIMVLSHFPIYEGIHDSSLKNYIKILASLNKRFTNHLFVFDGPMLTDYEIEQIMKENIDVGLSNIAVLHHEQVQGYLE